MTDDREKKEQKSKDSIQEVFNTVATEYGLGGAKFFHTSGQCMVDLLPLRGNEHVLDVACGTGAVAIPLSGRLPDGKVTAIDLSPGMLSQAKIHAESEKRFNINFKQGDMTAVPFEDRHFDHAVCGFGLFFVEEMCELLSHLKDKVKSGGSVTVSGFCGESFMPGMALLFDRLQSLGVEVPKTISWKRMAEPHQLNALFDDAGLNDVEITRRSLGYYTDVNGWWEVVWNAGFRRLVAQLGDDLEEFKRDHLAEMQALKDDKGLWLEVDVNFTRGTVP